MKNLLTTLFITFLTSVYGSHIPGGGMGYECIGNGQYVVTLTMYENCQSGFETNAPEPITITNSCGLPNPSGSLPNTIFQQEVTQLCPAQLGQSVCNGGTLPGFYIHQWSDTLTLSDTCDTWTFAYSSCCLNTTTNMSGQPGYYWEAQMYSGTDDCNSSATPNNPLIWTVCTNDTACIDLGFSDIDGDSLSYTLIPELTNATTPGTYNAGYSGSQPIPGGVLDVQTGLYCIPPSIAGSYILYLLVEEWENGELVGTQTYLTQVNLVNCSANNPVVGGNAYNVSGGTLAGTNQIDACGGANICFDVDFTDQDVSDSINVWSNVQQIFPGAVLNSSGVNPATATICIPTGGVSAGTYTIVVSGSDNACPIGLSDNVAVVINLNQGAYAGPDVAVCQSGAQTLNTSGTDVFNWSSISGDPIQVGTNFSCNPCANPIASPSQTTVYVGEITTSCGVIYDTVTFSVDNAVSIMMADSVVQCGQANIDPQVFPTSSSYSWVYNGNSISTDTILNTALLGAGNSGTVYLNVINGACSAIDSVYTTSGITDLTVNASDTIVCPGASVQLDVTVNGAGSGGCVNQYIGVTTGANTATSYPAPFGNWYKNAKHQFLFHASELTAMGLNAGPISEIGWEVTQVNGTTLYKQYSIRIDTTSANTMTNWLATSTQNFGPQDYTISTGYNGFTLAQPFIWDGISNIVVEICYDNLSDSTYTQNSITPWSTPTFTPTLYYRSDVTQACNYTGVPTTSPYRPVTRFFSCTPQSSGYGYSWTSNATLSDTSIIDPVVTMGASGEWVYVSVYDSTSGCTTTDSLFIDIQGAPVVVAISSFDSTICLGDSLSLNASSQNCNGCMFDWYLNGVFQNSGQSFGVMPNTGMSVVSVVGTDASGSCNGSDTSNVYVNEIMVEIIPDTTYVCANDTAFFELLLTSMFNDSGLSTTWNDVSTGASYIGTSDTTAIGLGFNNSGDLYVGVFGSEYGCFADDLAHVDVVAGLSLGSIVGAIQVNSGDTSIYVYTPNAGWTTNWNIVNGTIISGQGSDTVIVVWDNPGTGSIAVTLTDPNCSAQQTLSEIVTINPVGIQNVNKVVLNVYPNPARDQLIVTIGHDALGETLEILSVDGRLVYSSQLSSNLLEVDLSEFANGQYMLRVTGFHGVERFTKN